MVLLVLILLLVLICAHGSLQHAAIGQPRKTNTHRYEPRSVRCH
ncbi:hypothetical protein ACLGIH_20260 [Streptomyces sp. HMX87]